MGMAYDAARGQVVLFGGASDIGDSERHLDLGRHGLDAAHPAHSPSRADAHGHGLRRRPRPGRALRRAVTSGDSSATPGPGTARTGRKRTPAHSPPPRSAWAWPTTPPAARSCCSAAAASGLAQRHLDLGRHDWTQRTPAHSPSGREAAWAWPTTPPAARSCCSAASGSSAYLGDTWTWDGTDWTKRTPAHSPSARGPHGHGLRRRPGPGRAVRGVSAPALPRRHLDLGRHGLDEPHLVVDRLDPSIRTTGYRRTGSRFGLCIGEVVRLVFVDPVQDKSILLRGQGQWERCVHVPGHDPLCATPGRQHVRARGVTSGAIAKAHFTVK